MRDLHARRRAFPTIEAMAERIGVSFQYLARVLNGQRSPGDKVLKFLRVRKVERVWYERI